MHIDKHKQYLLRIQKVLPRLQELILLPHIQQIQQLIAQHVIIVQQIHHKLPTHARKRHPKPTHPLVQKKPPLLAKQQKLHHVIQHPKQIPVTHRRIPQQENKRQQIQQYVDKKSAKWLIFFTFVYIPAITSTRVKVIIGRRMYGHSSEPSLL